MNALLSTSEVEPHRRLDFWRASLSDMFAPVEVKNCRATDFRSQIACVQADNLMISQFDGVAQTIARPRSLIKPSDCDDYIAVIQLDGSIGHAMSGRESITDRGSITLYDLSRPYEFQASGSLSILDVSIRRADFERAFGPAPQAVGVTIAPDQASAPTIVGFFRSLLERAHLFDPVTAARMASIGLDMLAAGFAEKLALEPEPGASSAMLVYRAKTFIEDHLGEFELSVAAIANALNLSPRRLHEVFARCGLTVEGYLWERRLMRARTLLRDPAHDSVPVANIGYRAGFNSPAHFARRFRARFEQTPSEYRRQARDDRDNAAADRPIDP